MDSETLGRLLVTFAQSMKDWPILSLLVAGGFMLLSIPIVMLSKRLLDKLVPTRDTRMQTLLEDRGALAEQVAQWRTAAENAHASERALIEQATDLNKQLVDARKQRTSDPDANVESELKISELERRVANLRQLLDIKSRELTERDTVAENALASQRALMEQISDLEQQLASETGKATHFKGAFEDQIKISEVRKQVIKRLNERILRHPTLLEWELYSVIYSAVEEIASRSGNKSGIKVPTVEAVLSEQHGTLDRLTYEEGKDRRMVYDQINPAKEIRRILAELYENFYKYMNNPGFVHSLVDPNLMTIHVPSLQEPRNGALASVESPDTIGDVITRMLTQQILERIHTLVPGSAPLKLKFEWINLSAEEDPN